MQKVTVFVLLFLCLSTKITHAQNSNKEICAHLLSLFTYDPHQGDLYREITPGELMRQDKKIKNYLDKICTRTPATLHMDFSSLSDYLHVTTSDDGKIRAYSWTSPFNDIDNEFIQFQAGDSTKVIWDYKINGTAEEMASTFDYNTDYSSIVSIKTKDKKIVYLAIYYRNIPHARSQSDGIEAYVIDHGGLQSKPFFKTPKETLTSISYEWDGQGPTPCADSKIHLSDNKQKLYIPIVRDLTITTEYLVYVFDGNNYVFDKNAK